MELFMKMEHMDYPVEQSGKHFALSHFFSGKG
jgi:hypothetical protein